jgi:hypothetical protein
MSEFQVHNTAEWSDGPKSGGIVLKEDKDSINFTKLVKGDIIIYIKNL